MKAIYNDNLTIETRDDADQRNLHECWALQKVIEGKALVIGGGITPIKQNEPMHDGVSLWLAEDPTENAEIKLDIIPDMMDGSPIVKIICAPVCPDNEEETPSNPAEADSGQPAGNPVETAPSVTTLTAAAREYISNMTEDELIEHGHNEFNGKEQMIAALHTINVLATYNEAAAKQAYFCFIENNLSGMSFEIKN